MKKMVGIFFLFFLVGCNVQLNTPINLSYQEDILTWDEVVNATSYELTINEEVYIVEEESFDCSILNDGDYTSTVVAIADNKRSTPSNPFSFQIARTYPIPTNLRIEEGKFIWDEVDKAIGYQITSEEESIIIEENYILLNDIAPNDFYLFEVQSIFPFNHYSDKSSAFSYHSFSELDDKWEIDYDYASEDNCFIPINDIEIIRIVQADELIATSLYWIEAEELVISHTLLENYGTGKHTFTVFTNQGFLTLEIDSQDHSQPYMLSDGNISYLGEDITLEFELYGGMIVALDGAEIESDYTINQNQVIIRKEFIDELFSNPSRDLIVLGYQIENDYHYILGYVFINRVE
jgi:hypothetical protein